MFLCLWPSAWVGAAAASLHQLTVSCSRSGCGGSGAHRARPRALAAPTPALRPGDVCRLSTVLNRGCGCWGQALLCDVCDVGQVAIPPGASLASPVTWIQMADMCAVLSHGSCCLNCGLCCVSSALPVAEPLHPN